MELIQSQEFSRIDKLHDSKNYCGKIKETVRCRFNQF